MNYSGDHLPAIMRETVRNESPVVAEVLVTLDPLIAGKRELEAEQVNQILAFLHAQTSPSAVDLSHLVPESVPSGLPVWD